MGGINAQARSHVELTGYRGQSKSSALLILLEQRQIRLKSSYPHRDLCEGVAERFHRFQGQGAPLPFRE
jgi:hypothetical protein